MNATAIIVAAGDSRRIGGNTPKIFLPLCGRPMILRTLDRFFSARTIGKVVLVVAANERSRAKAMLEADAALENRAWALQSGGATRQESVRRGLEMIGDDSDVIAIHDGARPFVSPALIDRSVEAARVKGAVVVGLPVRDTVKRVAPDRWIESTPPRDSLWEIQTPQVFRRDLVLAAHARGASAKVEATDDAMLVEQNGERVFVLDGESTNFKITFADDFWLAETMLQQGRIP
ncbi:MAG: 2-C-methyl-D-erythritol 4-phosphate cytidylyltransferase [Candidatus Binatia bacterium]